MFATLTASGHTVTYVYGKETTKQNGQTTFTTNDNWKADTEGVTHHRAKCSVCGLYLDNDYVKHSYTEYVNVPYTGDVGYNRFAAVCECGHEVYASNQGAKNLRLALLNAAGLDIDEHEIKDATKVSVVHIVAPYWEIQGATEQGATKLNGIHVHLGTVKMIKQTMMQVQELSISTNLID